MRQVILASLLGWIAVALWYGAWSYLVTDDVEQVKTSINYHNQQFKSVTPNMVLKAESVSATGFPFRFAVAVKRLSWSMVEGKETYLVTTDMIEFEPMGSGEYRLHPTDQLDAMYAKDGGAPEHYHVTISDVPGFVLRAADEKPETPITEFRAFLPPVMTVKMELNGEERDAAFAMPKMDFMTYAPIPKKVERPLWLFVGVLREALVFKTPIGKTPEPIQ